MTNTGAKGFTLLEAMLVMALSLIAGSVALVQLKSTMTILDADKACNLVSSQLRYARQIAVDQRRNVTVDFLGTNEIKITRNNGTGITPTVMSDVFLPAGFTFSKPMGSGDTPDNYGAATAVYFNGGTSGTLLADGTFVSAAGIIMNGSVFTMGSTTASARAVTLTGASVRVKIYGSSGTSWVERT